MRRRVALFAPYLAFDLECRAPYGEIRKAPSPGFVAVVVSVSVKEISVAQSLPLGESSPSPGTWQLAAALHRNYVLSHLTLSIGGHKLAGTLLRIKMRAGFPAPALRYGLLVISSCGVYYLFVALHEQFFLGRR